MSSLSREREGGGGVLAAANNGKGYFDWKTVTSETIMKDSTLLEIWKVSKYYGKTTEEILKASGQDKKKPTIFLGLTCKAISIGSWA